MAYIGKSPSTKFSAAAKQDTFTGDGSTTTFDVANIIPAGGENSIQVFVDNVRQKPGSSNAYTIGNDGSGDLKRITFTAAPDASAEIYVITPFEATNIKNIGDGTVTTAKLADDSVTTGKIVDGTIAAGDLAGSIPDSKLSEITTASKVNVSSLSAPGSTSLFLRGDRSYAAIPTDQIDSNAFNISLLGFKMAVNEGLTVFNLVDGIVDEFHDESGTDEAEGSNDTYCATSDYYHNITFTPATYSAGFTTTAVTEEDTSEAGTNPKQGCGSFGTFTVPTGLTALTANIWGSGGGGACSPQPNLGGGGGFSSGVLATTPGQALTVVVGEGGEGSNPVSNTGTRGGLGGYRPSPARAWPTQTVNTGGGGSMNPQTSGTLGYITGGGGLSGIFSGGLDEGAPTAYLIAGSGGGGEYSSPAANNSGGGGGGTVGYKAGAYPQAACQGVNGGRGGGGDQEQGGAGGTGSQNGGGPSSSADINASVGGLFYGGNNALRTDSNGTYGAGGGSGYYGGGGGAWRPGIHGAGGGGSSYIGHPQISSGATEASAPDSNEGGGTTSPLYVAGTNEGGTYPVGDGEDGYVLLTGSGCTQSPGATTAIISNAFAATSVPTTSRIVVFQENVDSPTLNTDIIASISRDGGSNFTTATLTDSGYVTGSSGQRILTGQATISGQPSGQSMRWKLALANNTVRIHGVSLQWS